MSGQWTPIVDPKLVDARGTQGFGSWAFHTLIQFANSSITVEENWRTVFRVHEYYDAVNRFTATPTPWTSYEQNWVAQEIAFASYWWNQAAATIRIVPSRDTQFKGKFIYDNVLKHFGAKGFTLKFGIKLNAPNPTHWNVQVMKSFTNDPGLRPNSPIWSHVEPAPGRPDNQRIVLNTAHMTAPYSYDSKYPGPRDTPARDAITTLRSSETIGNAAEGIRTWDQVLQSQTQRPSLIAHEFGHTLYTYFNNPGAKGNEAPVFYVNPDEYGGTTEFLQRAKNRYSVQTILANRFTLRYDPDKDALMGNDSVSMKIHGRYFVPILVNLAYMMPGLWFDLHAAR
jgi:hypothetical protein